MEIVIGELSELKAKVTQIKKELPQGLIVVDGAMGAGKTTLIAENRVAGYVCPWERGHRLQCQSHRQRTPVAVSQ